MYLNGKYFDMGIDEAEQILTNHSAILDQLQLSEVEASKLKEALTDVRKRFVQDTLDYNGGCTSGKIEFLQSIGLEDFIPEGEAEFTVKVKWSYAGDDDPDESDLKATIENQLEYDYDVTSVDVRTVVYKSPEVSG